MDAKAITEKSKELQKAVGSNAAPDVIKSILNELRKGVQPSEEILRSTRIGVTVNKLKQYKSRDIAALAHDIVSKWREEVEAKRGNGAAKKRSVTSPSGTGSPAPSQQQDTLNKSQQQYTSQPSEPTTPNVALDKRTQKTDGIEVKPTGNAVRDRCAGLIYDGLAFSSPDPPKAVLTSASAIEAEIHSKLGPEDKEAYKTKIRSLYQNLKANGDLRGDLLGGKVTPEKFVAMTHEELKSADRRKEDKDLEKENMRLAQAPKEEKSLYAGADEKRRRTDDDVLPLFGLWEEVEGNSPCLACRVQNADTKSV
ncbi:MAG: hypothetical protein LQ340_002120 [Diploschistes diacapsis]|nr:MAG: hypothetical protein LQ340_002120 [Diploschistes diacapsis]